VATISHLRPSRRIEWQIPVPRLYDDHRFEDRAVVPAVVALRHLAGAVDRYSGQPACHTILDARFERLLPLPAEARVIDVLIELIPGEVAWLEARLMTRRIAARSGISRLLTHVRAVFGAPPIEVPTMAPASPSAPADGIVPGACTFPAARLYTDLVPFGPAFQNVIDMVELAPDRAGARVRAPHWPEDHQPACGLGSPYPLDAAFHVACAWGQRFNGGVPFPVGFERLVVAAPTSSGGDYHCRVFPRGPDGAQLVFDIDLVASSGRVVEKLVGLRMQDIRRQPFPPPRWIRAVNAP
jgi:hypothetical protein